MKTATMSRDFLANMSIPSDMPESGCYISMPGFEGMVTRAELQAMVDAAPSKPICIGGGGGSGAEPFGTWLFQDGHTENLKAGEIPVWPKVDAARLAGKEEE